ncbi:MAG: hypothetical protein AB8B85_22365 [Paracoccaceae bacterium]
MSEDQKRDPELGRAEGTDPGLFSDRSEDNALGSSAGDRVETPPAVDADAIAKHRAAKEARIRQRMKQREGAAAGVEARVNGPADAQPKKGPKGSALPALRPDLKADTPALRAERVEAIRRDLVRRRRRKGGGMLVKLWLFVLLPTVIVAWFMWFKASELYKSDSQFMVQSASGGSSGGGGLLSSFLGGGGGGIFDPNAVYSYIYSRDVLKRLDAEHGWVAHFQQPQLDYWHRLPADASFEAAYQYYTEYTTVSYDPSEGMLELSMVAADPESAYRFSTAIIGYAEEMVNRLSERIQADAVRDADGNLVDAEERLRQAQQSVAELQKALDTFTVEGEVAAEMQIIGGMEVELEALRGRQANLLRVTGRSDPRVQRISNQIETLQSQIANRRQNLTGNSTEDETSLADINLAMTKARFEVEASSAIFAAAVERREVANANARRQGRYLEMVSSPSMPDQANYPKKLETTALAFFGFLGFYIIGSLTVSLIREQASI